MNPHLLDSFNILFKIQRLDRPWGKTNFSKKKIYIYIIKFDFFKKNNTTYFEEREGLWIRNKGMK